MKKTVFWAVLAAAVLIPLIAFAWSWGILTLNQQQLTLLKATPDKEVTIDLNPSQLAIVHAKFPGFKGKSVTFKFVHVYENDKIRFAVENGKLHSIPLEDKWTNPNK